MRDLKSWQQGKRAGISSFIVIERGDFDIVLLEDVKCENKEQLHKKEREYIEKLDCVNKIVPTRTKSEYYQANREVLLERNKAYYQAHSAELNEKMRAYHKAHSVELSRKKKQYYQVHREELLSKLMRSQECGCGSSYTHCHKARHERSQKHQEWIKNSNISPQV